MKRLRKHLNPTTGIAFVALIFAVTGVSFAATGSGSGSGSSAGFRASASSATLTATASKAKSKAKPKVKVGPRGPAGPQGAVGAPGTAGATGPAGAAGAQGPVGSTGPVGANGTNGTNGKDGKDGKTGFTATLPSNSTETGTWVVGPITAAAIGGREVRVPISFPIPLAAALLGQTTVHFLKENGEEEFETEESRPSEACHGNVAEPSADPGNLCIYTYQLASEAFSWDSQILRPSQESSTGADVSGTTVNIWYLGSGTLAGYGTWAVTAP